MYVGRRYIRMHCLRLRELLSLRARQQLLLEQRLAKSFHLYIVIKLSVAGTHMQIICQI